jgi:hypothetical protein
VEGILRGMGMRKGMGNSMGRVNGREELEMM